jgi:hypothetical protein
VAAIAQKNRAIYLPEFHHTLTDLFDRGYLRGYEPGAGPAEDPLIEAAYDEAAKLGCVPCLHCGSRSFRVIRLHRGNTIRRFMQCLDCRDAEEV